LKVIIQTDTQTQHTDCNTWTTKWSVKLYYIPS